MKRLALILPILAVSVACGSGRNLAGTKLTLTAYNPNIGLAVFHLDCGPTGGDVSDPAVACSSLGHDPKLVTSPQPFTCLGGPQSWFDMTIAGRFAGRPLQRKFSTCWTPQMAMLDKLGLANTLRRHVRPRRRGLVLAGATHTFPPGELRRGDLIVCTILHHRLELPISGNQGPVGRTGVGFGGKYVEVGNSPEVTTVDVVHVSLGGTRNADGSITANCRRGKT